ncbi:hypothetical protein WR25_07083 [Diploscapter pachys]|uniref:SXP/RAL-2 family protein Ani s 5-like cation-binding domain-containing protein n=1 Tax=Diploscapter pachys TaxID=2018661 RepID=A0A2A2LMM4_9BILA|nr:hypothetical protein WR25_07083 [Diploscapter pachys]
MALIRLIFLLLPLASPQVVVYDAETASDSNSTSIPLTTSNLTDFSTTELPSYNLFENYFPLLLLLISLPQNETDALEIYMAQKNYANLKDRIDQKQQEANLNIAVEVLESNNTNLASIVENEKTQITITLVEAYHNASIYNAVRSLWNEQFQSILPIIDQFAILQYFTEKKQFEYDQMSFWTRIWTVIRAWVMGTEDYAGCYANVPMCVREVVEKMPMERRIELDQAATDDENIIARSIIERELAEERKENSLEEWRGSNTLPLSLKLIIDELDEVELEALERLRQHGLVSSLKDYYRVAIESRTHDEQENEYCHFPNRGFRSSTTFVVIRVIVVRISRGFSGFLLFAG